MALDPTTDIGRVRLLIQDTDDAARLFSDPEITAFLDLSESNVRLAAATALEALAADSARLAKMVKTLNFAQDTRQAAATLLAVANQLRESDSKIPAFAIAEQSVSDPNRWEIDANYDMRN